MTVLRCMVKGAYLGDQYVADKLSQKIQAEIAIVRAVPTQHTMFTNVPGEVGLLCYDFSTRVVGILGLQRLTSIGRTSGSGEYATNDLQGSWAV